MSNNNNTRPGALTETRGCYQLAKWISKADNGAVEVAVERERVVWRGVVPDAKSKRDEPAVTRIGDRMAGMGEVLMRGH